MCKKLRKETIGVLSSRAIYALTVINFTPTKKALRLHFVHMMLDCVDWSYDTHPECARISASVERVQVYFLHVTNR